MNILCFDISTGGLSAAVFDDALNASNLVESTWDIALKADGAAVLAPNLFKRALVEVTRQVSATDFTVRRLPCPDGQFTDCYCCAIERILPARNSPNHFAAAWTQSVSQPSRLTAVAGARFEPPCSPAAGQASSRGPDLGRPHTLNSVWCGCSRAFGGQLWLIRQTSTVPKAGSQAA